MSSRHDRRLERAAIAVASKVSGALPWGAGQYRLANRYASAGRWPTGSGSIVRQRMRSGARVELDLGDRTQALAYLLRDFSPEIVAYLDARLPLGGVCFDAGANVGLVSFGLAARRPDVQIHAFEPGARNAARWLRNRTLNGAVNATLSQAAVSASAGVASFAVPTDSGSGMVVEDGGETVPTVSLAGYCADRGIERIDALKLDIQGHEPAAIAGARELLERQAIGAVVCEIDDALLGGADVVALMAQHGYVPEPLPPVGLRRLRPGARAVADVAFVPR